MHCSLRHLNQMRFSKPFCLEVKAGLHHLITLTPVDLQHSQEQQEHQELLILVGLLEVLILKELKEHQELLILVGRLELLTHKELLERLQVLIPVHL